MLHLNETLQEGKWKHLAAGADALVESCWVPYRVVPWVFSRKLMLCDWAKNTEFAPGPPAVWAGENRQQPFQLPEKNASARLTGSLKHVSWYKTMLKLVVFSFHGVARRMVKEWLWERRREKRRRSLWWSWRRRRWDMGQRGLSAGDYVFPLSLTFQSEQGIF